MLSQNILLVSLLYAAQALGAVHESLSGVPAGWTLIQEADLSTPISLTISLVFQNLDSLESTLKAVSTPGSPTYGHYLDKDDIDRFFPAVNAFRILSWLENAGVSNAKSTGRSVHFTTTVGTANELLGTKFSHYGSGPNQKLRTLQYSIPNDLIGDIDVISPTIYFGKSTANTITSISQRQETAKTTTTRTEIPPCSEYITPSCLIEAYNVGNYTPIPEAGSRVSFLSAENQSAIYSDLAVFEQTFGIPPQNFSVELINGGTNNQDLATAQYEEANLDVQSLISISHPLPVTEYILGASTNEANPAVGEIEPFLDFFESLLWKQNSALPQVISNSYNDDEALVPELYAQRLCQLVGLAGLRGISVLQSSGDIGIGDTCRSPENNSTLQFLPQFPGTCPYITAVGGTQGLVPEVAWEASSGGFSNYFTRAWYQEEAVDNYVSNHVSTETKEYYGQYTNFSGRGFPDIAAHSLAPNYVVIYNGSLSTTGGTSASAPVWAGLVALLNDARLRAGKPVLGFLNPLLYSIGQNGLNDITSGASDGCNGTDLQTGQAVPNPGIIPGAHWNATQGWDPVTGLGTPDFQKLVDIVLAL